MIIDPMNHVINPTPAFKIKYFRSGEMAEQLRVLDALPSTLVQFPGPTRAPG